MSFKHFILNENKHYLGQRAGDLLTALQNLAEDAPQMGNRALLRACQGVVAQIRRILHGRWDEGDVKYLKALQKVGVAIMKAIDENGDLKEVVASAVAEVEHLIDKLQVPINDLGTEDQSDGQGEEPPPAPTPGEGDEPLPRGYELEA